MKYLFQDPRPEFGDTDLWTKLLRTIPKIENIKKAERLQKRLWSFRSLGTMVRRTHLETKLIPVLHPDGAWENEAEFEEIKRKYLREYTQEMKWLFSEVWSE